MANIEDFLSTTIAARKFNAQIKNNAAPEQLEADSKPKRAERLQTLHQLPKDRLKALYPQNTQTAAADTKDLAKKNTAVNFPAGKNVAAAREMAQWLVDHPAALFSPSNLDIAGGMPFFKDGLSKPYFGDFKPLRVGMMEAAVSETSPNNMGGFLPSATAGFDGKTRAAVAFDWIKFSAKLQDGFLAPGLRKTLRVTGDATAGIVDIHRNNGKEWEAVAEMKVLAGKGQTGWVTVKLANKQCYQPGADILRLIIDICNETAVKFMHYSRLDVAFDMQKTDYRNISCQQFLDKVAKGDYVFKGKLTANIVGLPDYEELATAEVVRRQGKTQTVYVGRRVSGLSITMYNKSLEMRMKNDKPYIKSFWEQSGMQKGFETFRVEFSHIKDCKQYVVCNSDGELEELKHTDIEMVTKLKQYSDALWKYHFKVAKYEKGVRFSRLAPVEILAADAVHCYCERDQEKQKSHNHIKYMIKNVALEGLKAHAAGEKIYASELFRFVHNMVDRHALEGWYENNLARYGLKQITMTYADYQTEIAMQQGIHFIAPEINYRAYEQ